jgi:hypothetical protein
MPAAKTANPKGAIIQALLKCQMAVESIPKTGTAPAVMGGFKFAEVGAVVAAARAAMIDNGLLLTARVSSDVTPHIDEQGITHVLYTFDLWHESGECIEDISSIYAHGGDRNSKGGWGDKGGNKASTAAQKYGIIRLFNIPTVDDDSDGHALPETERPARRAPARRAAPRPAPSPAPAPPPQPSSGGHGEGPATEAELKAAKIYPTGFKKAEEFYSKDECAVDPKKKFCAIDFALGMMGVRTVKQLRVSQLDEFVNHLHGYPGPFDNADPNEPPPPDENDYPEGEYEEELI